MPKTRLVANPSPRRSTDLTLLGELAELLERGELEAAAHLIGRRFEADHAALWLWHPVRGVGVVPERLADSWDMDFLEAGRGICTDADPVLAAYERHEPVEVADARGDVRFASLRRHAERLDFRGALFLPLCHQGTGLGTLSLHFKGALRLGAGDRALLTALARQVSVAVRAAFLADELAAARADFERGLASNSRELAAEKALAERVIMHVPAAVALLEPDLTAIGASPPFARLAGQRTEALAGASLRRVAPRLARALEPLVREAIAQNAPARSAAMPLGTAPWDVTVVPLPGSPTAVLVLAVDAADHQQATRSQEQRIADLQRQDKQKDDFLSILSHELRTPINAIMGFGSILEDGVAGPLTGRQAEYLHRIMTGSELLLGLINDLLDMSRIRAGKFTIAPEATDFAAIAHDVAEALAPLAEQKHLAVTLRLPNSVPLVADPRRVAQALTNLISNAIKYTPEGGAITVTARQNPRQLRCEVTDTGPGIAPRDRERLFDKFVQLELGRAEARASTGLGLAISRSIVEAHGGSIGVEGGPTKGSTFWFTLPLRVPVLGHPG